MLKIARSPVAHRPSRGAVPTVFGSGRRQRPSHYLGNVEPDLDEILGDDVIRRMMDSDGVQPDLLLALAARVREAAA
jgi:hypothetical protein